MIRLEQTSLALLLLLTAAPFTQAQPPASTFAETPRIDRIDIVEKGIYRAPVIKNVDDPNVLADRRLVYGEREHVKDTTTIPATKGTQFGFRFLVDGEPKGKKVPVRIVAIYPKGGRYNPNNGKTATRDEWPITATIGSTTNYFCFTLSSWGLVPGTWTLQVWGKDRKYAEQEFTLSAPATIEFDIQSEFGDESAWTRSYLEQAAGVLVTLMENPAVAPPRKIRVSLRKDPNLRGISAVYICRPLFSRATAGLRINNDFGFSHTNSGTCSPFITPAPANSHPTGFTMIEAPFLNTCPAW
jgi:hypothetical protein